MMWGEKIFDNIVNFRDDREDKLSGWKVQRKRKKVLEIEKKC